MSENDVLLPQTYASTGEERQFPGSMIGGKVWVRDVNTLVSAEIFAEEPSYVCIRFEDGRTKWIPRLNAEYYLNGEVIAQFANKQ